MMEYVIKESTGDLLRFGYCDFVNDGAFDAVNETVITNYLINPKVRGRYLETRMSRWNGSGWIEVNQP